MPAITIFVARLQQPCYLNLKSPDCDVPGSAVAGLLGRDIKKVLPEERVKVFLSLMKQIVEDFEHKKGLQQQEEEVSVLEKSFWGLGLGRDEADGLEESFGGLRL
jgi:hypothetical protein